MVSGSWPRLVAVVAAGAVLIGMAGPAASAAEPAVSEPAVSAGQLSWLAAEEVALGPGADAEVLVPGDRPGQEVSVPADAEDPVVIDAPGRAPVEVDLPSGADAEQLGARAVVYDAFGPAAHVLVEQPDTGGTGMRALITIGGPQARSEYPFSVDLPAGARWQLQPDGAVHALTDDGQPVMVLPPPWAVDAAGADLPTFYRVHGDTVIQHIDHRAATYPVIADPWFLVAVAAVVGRAATTVVVKAIARKQAAKQAAKQARAELGEKGRAGKVTRKPFKPLTRKNARHNLAVKTGKDPKHCQAHHIIPVFFEDRVGKLNIHDPRWLVWWDATPKRANNHPSLARRYNQDWDDFFDANPKPSAEAIAKHADEMDDKYRKYYGTC